MTGFTTQVIHTPLSKKDPHGSLHMPIYENVAFEFESAEAIEMAFHGRRPGHAYSRISNPTVEHFEQQIKAATEATGVIAVSSGMAAISNLFLSVLAQGDNIILAPHLFGNTYSLVERTLRPLGITASYADFTQPERIEGLITDRTRIIFCETITNPHLEIYDLEAIVAIARKHKVLFVVDSTLTPPNIFKAKAIGVDIEVVSSTKCISGGATSVEGLIIDYGSYDWAHNPLLAADAKKYGPFALLNKLRRESYRNLGACLSPHNAYLQSLGLETVDLRYHKAASNALQLALYLQKKPSVVSVNYPGLKESAYYALSQKLFNGVPGSLLTFDLASKEDAFAFINKVQLIRRATNISDNRTLLIHPASTIFCEYSPEEKAKMGICETTLRLSVGIEDPDDLIADINQALEGA